MTRSSLASDYDIAMPAGMGFTGGMGGYPTVQVMDGVADADPDDVHAAIAIPTGAGESTTVTTGITDPPEYRALSITSAGAAALSDVVITGTDWAGRTQTETITGTGAATVDGNLPFATVTEIVVWGVAAPSGATYTIGFNEKLGLYRDIDDQNTGTALDGDVTQILTKATADTAWTITAAGVLPTGASVNATYNTVDPETTITDVDGYAIFYNACDW
jgi:hypothetical protein